MTTAMIRLTPAAVVRTVFPFADDIEVEVLLWEFTGWPAFWHSMNPLSEIRESLLKLDETLRSGQRPCFFCNEPATVKDHCAECDSAWQKQREGKR